MDKQAEYHPDESFRDSVSTISKEGRRSWIYAQRPKGKFYTARSIVSIFYLILFFSLPFVRVHGDPFFLFNILERRFVFFGVTFWPQDFFLFGIGMLVFIVFVVLFTVVFGRIFCGWICPQTIFMEMVFRRIEYWIEGDATYQKQLTAMPWNGEKLLKRGGKHVVFFLFAFLISNTFLAYIIGTDQLFSIIREPVSMHVGGFISLLVFTGIFYAVYAWFREQVCLIACPYGRLQGVMTDRNTLLVAYDYIRGEPRGKYRKTEGALPIGDCIDCFQCVKVCPVAIDIRNGTQLECTNCTACIDACDFMMEKTGHPKGLIRYASENGIAKGERLKITPRIIAYSIVLIGLIGILAVLLITRKDVDATILRTPGMLYQEQDNGRISNLYNIKLVNKTHNDAPITLRLENQEGMIKIVGKPILAAKTSETSGTFFIFLPKNKLTDRKTKLRVSIWSKGKLLQTVKTNFMGPSR
ncbi:MAG: cytochrome c oxidase accessory protein CcoG [Candidatus Fluviicola riflensis]|nr:MAG: cytochrome c oxidase accessory protein CcoG [Candidatus Fluviicola riflensis]OGS77849.1 MAG: cytochrome c oxidase accessory protein CcoG [Candidatus Fluviicola riflensis]OGS84914.1 MAG: cytochrome c oxidase accessory protein CcoG [Fluviicola sp. RIFCSPHIGHO2_01_FULL_43_53]OGS89186.1 MAG: cytochrome c oxidase accessory protein CcoG [Fluviicola sp. RIFCSPHIGHO2_12_FULL_43_24]